MLPGTSRQRFPRNRSQAHSGIQPLDVLTHRTQRFQPLPPPLGEPPYHYDLATSIPTIGATAQQQGHIVFHTVGDTGGINQGTYQREVAKALKDDLNLPTGQVPSFFYHLGDVVYYNGEYSKYYDEFYEPYDYYTPPILSIPGNHDGDPVDATQTSLDGWVAYFMTATPHVDPASHDAPRTTLSLPNVYYSVIAPFVTLVGIYTNVPEGGSVDSVQQQWLTNELATAPTDKALIVSMHHPIYSFDDHHSGSPRMADVLQQAINDSRRVPNMVLAAHVHNYQRIERPILDSQPTPFLVIGNGGYYHLHNINADPGITDPNTGAHLIFSDATNHGYMTLTVDAQTITGSYTQVANTDGQVTKAADTFNYPAKALTLAKKAAINL